MMMDIDMPINMENLLYLLHLDSNKVRDWLENGGGTISVPGLPCFGIKDEYGNYTIVRRWDMDQKEFVDINEQASA